MASPRKSGGARSAPVQMAPAPIETSGNAPAVENPVVIEEPAAVDVETSDVESAQAVETTPVLETLATFEAAPVVEPAPLFADEAAEMAAFEAVAEKTETPQTVSAPPVNAIVDVSKVLEAPMASLTEAQAKARALAETSIVETRAKFSQFKNAADEASSAFEMSYATVKNGAIEFNTKAIEALKATAEANFDFVKSIFGAKTPSEYVTLHSEFARKQFEALQTQTKSFGELAQKIATETVEPIKAQVAKTFNISL